MKKILILAISLIGTLSLTGCEQSVGVTGGCVGSNSVQPKCNIGAAYRMTWKSAYTSFDANLVSVDLSQSNVDLTSNSGNITIAIKNGAGTTIASSVFQWYRVGNVIYPSNTSTMSNFVNNNLQDLYEVNFDIQDIESTANIGSTNSFVAIYHYENSEIGASDSFYLNNADLNNF